MILQWRTAHRPNAAVNNHSIEPLPARFPNRHGTCIMSAWTGSESSELRAGAQCPCCRNWHRPRTIATCNAA